MQRTVIRSGRMFQWWSYTATHSQLLLRSARDAVHATQVDVLFKDVVAVQLSTLFTGLMVMESDEDAASAPQALEGRSLFRVQAGTIAGYVIAGAVFTHEGPEHYYDDSPLLRGEDPRRHEDPHQK